MSCWKSSEVAEWHARILELHNRTFPSVGSFKDVCGCFADPMWILVADGDELLGMAAIGEDQKGLFVYNVAVDHLHRRRHVGSRMMEVLRKTFPGKACRGRVSKDNDVAIHFYEKMGAVRDREDEGFIYYRFVLPD